MARDPDEIQREIEKAREALAVTLDELETKANPTRVIESGKASVRDRLEDPRVRYALIGVGAIVTVALVRKLFR